MNMSWIDWAIVVGFMVTLFILGWQSRVYSGNVANFLAAGRCAGRYLIAVAGGVAGWGAISAVAAFELYYQGGFSIQWWFLLMMVGNLIASISGWMIYRFRQTRSLTVPQFLEQRYSRGFRITAGFLCWFSGIMNFGLFPAIGARFFIHFCGIPETYTVAGFAISTYATIIAGLLAIVLFFLFVGGQIAIIVTDFFQGLYCNIVFLITIIFLFSVFSWSQITEALATVPEGQSMIHPLEAAKTPDFNFWFYIIGFVSLFYSWVVGSGTQGFDVAAKNPHEARMGKILNNWRSTAQALFIILIPTCAFTLLHHPDFAAKAGMANSIISEIHGRSPAETHALQTQMTVPVAMTLFLAKGLMGAICAVMLAAFIANHESYMHSWGSILVQDVIIPLRRRQPEPKEHLKMLRWSIFFVAVFIFIFSLLYRQNEYILMFMMFTGTIYIGGAGVVVIGGLYWKRGTTAGAWCALLLGVVFAFAGQILRRVWPDFPINSQWVFAIAMVVCSAVYVIVSLLSKQVFDMDKLLHRGRYAVAEDNVVQADEEPVRGWKVLINMGREFTIWDKIVYLSSVGWTLLLCAVFLIGTVYGLLFKTTRHSWEKFWWIYIIIQFVLSVVTTIWFIAGGLKDYRDMFRLLKLRKADNTDDGRVTSEEHKESLTEVHSK